MLAKFVGIVPGGRFSTVLDANKGGSMAKDKKVRHDHTDVDSSAHEGNGGDKPKPELRRSVLGDDDIDDHLSDRLHRLRSPDPRDTGK